ncbi:isoprenylcysteine carboxyl methyltransferase family protein [Hazenella coriacea]|uniref:15-methylpalmitoyl-4-hydroxy-2-pyrone 4-O-methyltransferase n=1 Tax=Hazenella coriacea TaxID=1179467 RepID=A0A4R3LCB6_9BACL|nr:isoprenylcysteine carboxylmethyltransferase family protein [Hazenella coriacea]TCS96948.1 15-methylpalmitoyl-4-hydroxy-2-pyrone 4-O-methyltransferase [Hazenella coriacea]
MQMSGWLFLWLAVIVQRVYELYLAKKNERWLKLKGGFEVGRKHYPMIWITHVLFFAGILLEVLLGAQVPAWVGFPLALFLLTQVLRIWCIRSLGRYWNTKIWIVPQSSLQMKGPYRYLRHPNYLVVMLEVLVFPLIFGAYWTALSISILNTYVLLAIRIPIEEKALLTYTSYQESMGEKKRFFPFLLR